MRFTYRLIFLLSTFMGLTILPACVPLEDLPEILEDSNPAPSDLSLATLRAFRGIQQRNWNLYSSAFEPTTSNEQELPGPVGEFIELQFGQWENLFLPVDGKVVVRAVFSPSINEQTEDGNYYLNAVVDVVKASNSITIRASIPLLEGVPLTGDLTYYKEGWFIKFSEVDVPFNLTRLYQPTRIDVQDGVNFIVGRDDGLWIVNTEDSTDVKFLDGLEYDRYSLIFSDDGKYAYSKLIVSSEEKIDQSARCWWGESVTSEVSNFISVGNCLPISWVPNSQILLVDIGDKKGHRQAIVDVATDTLIFQTEDIIESWNLNQNLLLLETECIENVQSIYQYSLLSKQFEGISDRSYCYIDPVVSPDGTQIVFQKVDNQGGYSLNLYHSGDYTELFNSSFLRNRVLREVQWDGLGKNVFFDFRILHPEGHMVFRYNIDTKELSSVVNIPNTESYEDELQLSPDGNNLSIMLDEKAIIVNLRSLESIYLYPDYFEVDWFEDLSWSPDGKWLLITGRTNLVNSLSFSYKVEQPNQKFFLGAFNLLPEWVPNQNFIYAVLPRDLNGNHLIDDEGYESVELIMTDVYGAWRWVTRNENWDSHPIWVSGHH